MKRFDSETEISRREFLKTTGVAAGLAASSLVSASNTRASVALPKKIIGANDRINYAIVGVGGTTTLSLTPTSRPLIGKC
ncbi:MAG TPA: twin-arginine translocation signal domain-containing protein [Blastocatellia bacterium]|nr:twin-arginine translocation signal domain-containing protein [Blastocatellia bacterium]